MLFYVGINSIGRFTNAYLLLTELMPEKYDSFVGPLLLAGDSATIFYLTIYYRFISKNSFPIFWFGLSLNIICFIITFFWVPESVKWLVSV